jgi:hypothetical protein
MRVSLSLPRRSTVGRYGHQHPKRRLTALQIAERRSADGQSPLTTGVACCYTLAHSCSFTAPLWCAKSLHHSYTCRLQRSTICSNNANHTLNAPDTPEKSAQPRNPLPDVAEHCKMCPNAAELHKSLPNVDQHHETFLAHMRNTAGCC